MEDEMSDVHHENPNTYPDSWEDCLVAYEGRIIENATTAEYWGGKDGDAMASFCDYTDGPHTRVRFIGDLETLKQLSPEDGATDERRLRADACGEFVVSEYEAGRGPFDCVTMRVDKPIDPEGIHAITVEKWVDREQIAALFPIGRRFTLEPLAR